MEICNSYALPYIDFVGGSTQTLAFNCLYLSTKEPVELARCTATFALLNWNNRHGEAELIKSMSIVAGTYKNDTYNNIVTVTLTPSETVSLSGKYIYQITLKDSAGTTEIPNQGIMHIVNNINKTAIS